MDVGARDRPAASDASAVAGRRGRPRIGTAGKSHFGSTLRTRGSFAYGRGVSEGRSDVTESAWPKTLTWRAHDVPRMESVRVQLSGNRIKADGRIGAAPTASPPPFSASYDLVTDEAGATKRLSLTVTFAECERQLSIARDEENMWLVQHHTGE